MATTALKGALSYSKSSVSRGSHAEIVSCSRGRPSSRWAGSSIGAGPDQSPPLRRWGRISQDRNLHRQQLLLLQSTACTATWRRCSGAADRRPQAGAIAPLSVDDQRLRHRCGTMCESYFRPERDRLLFVRRPATTSCSTSCDKLFDVAIMMDCSQCPIHPQAEARCSPSTRRRTATSSRATGARPIFFMSWAYADKPEMTAQLAEAYTSGGQRQQCAGDPGGPRLRQGGQQAARARSLRRRQAPSERGRHLSRRPAWCLRR